MIGPMRPTEPGMPCGRSGENELHGIGAEEIRRAIGEPYFSRGQAYHRRGAVRSVEIKSPDRVKAQVKGTALQPYLLSALLKYRSDGTLGSVEGDCSCPVGFNCKHIAAALLAAAGARPFGSASTGSRGTDSWTPDLLTPGSSVPGPRTHSFAGAHGAGPGRGEVRQWLDRRPRARAKPAAIRQSGPVRTGQQHLFYVFHRDWHGGMRITPYRAYLKKNGEIGANYREFTNRRSAWARGNLTLQDAALLGQLEFFGEGGYPQGSNLPEGPELVKLIRVIVETGRALDGGIHGRTLSWSAPRKCELRWEVGDGGEQRAVARGPEGAPLTLLGFGTPFYLDPETGEAGVAETALEPHLASWLAQAPAVPPDAVESVTSSLDGIGGHGPLPRPARLEQRADVPPEPVLILYGCEIPPQVRYGNDTFARRFGAPAPAVYPCARLEIAYESVAKRVRSGKGANLLTATGEPPALILRDRAGESALLRRLTRAGERHGGREPHGLYFAAAPPEGLRDADVVLPAFREGDGAAATSGVGFAAQAVTELRQAGWRVRIDDTWPFRVFDGPVSFSATVEPSERDWFSLCLRLEANGSQFDIAPLVVQLVDSLPVDEQGRLRAGFDLEGHLAGRLFHAELDDGAYLAIDASSFAGFAEAFLEAQGLIGFHRAEAGRLFDLAEALEGCGARWTGGRELLELGARLRALADAPDVAPPAPLRGELRAYQRTGFGWLKALSESGFGGVLADDMGLGKTVQTLALLAHRHLELKVGRPSLLVVPTSLVGNWRREAERFTPGLKVLVLHGPQRRRRFGEIPDRHLVVTTYPLVNRDHEALFAHEYDTAVLDEAQAVKNPAAGVSKRIRDIRARHRLALTGTPLENSLQELWSLYDWLVPGLLGARREFTKNYLTPIEKHGDAARQRMLSTRIKPFLMRRTKEEVAAELPAKTVIDERVPLAGGQAALYESIRTAMDARVREAVAARGLAASRIAILDALLKLRQACCDPGLVKLDAARKVKASAKRTRLLELLESLIAEGRRVLVFSQFVQMLRLLESDIAGRGWDYAMLHGGTRDRDGQVARFQSGAVPLFLISLKAGGTGLNLTAADTVIVYDPWWNPAVERQAMDRAHRIGQDKPVFVYRLIAESTVEAAIQRMQARKQALADALFEGAGSGPLGITDADLDALFAASPSRETGNG